MFNKTYKKNSGKKLLFKSNRASINSNNANKKGLSKSPVNQTNAEEIILENGTNTSQSSFIDQMSSSSSISLPDQFSHLKHENENDIHFVLVYDKSKDDSEKKKLRKSFQSNLSSIGIKLKIVEGTVCKDLTFIHVNTPFSVLVKTGEVLKMKKTIKMISLNNDTTKNSLKVFKKKSLSLRITDTLDSNKIKKFIDAQEELFTDLDKIFITFILLRKIIYIDKGHMKAGINGLLAAGAYIDAYPLHDELANKLTVENSIILNDRNRLIKKCWSFRRCFQRVPLNLMRHYFGEKIAFFYAWQELYIMMLIPAMIVGLITFIFGAIFSTVGSTELEYLCDSNNYPGRYLICPLCDDSCNYTRLSNSCVLARISALFDHYLPIFCSLFICIWGTIYIRLWKKKENILRYRWSITKLEIQRDIRPQFILNVTTKKQDNFTMEHELELPKKKKVPTATLR